jgi:hypothetical protein
MRSFTQRTAGLPFYEVDELKNRARENWASPYFTLKLMRLAGAICNPLRNEEERLTAIEEIKDLLGR